jgi:hypothetical protein
VISNCLASGYAGLAHALPPVANGIDREFCGVVINAQAHPLAEPQGNDCDVDTRLQHVHCSRVSNDVSPATTHMYVEADLAMKERTLKTLQAPSVKTRRFWPKDQLLAFLEGL